MVFIQGSEIKDSTAMCMLFKCLIITYQIQPAGAHIFMAVTLSSKIVRYLVLERLLRYFILIISYISGNTANENGGGLVFVNATANIREDTVITNNSAPTGWGGGIYATNVTFSVKSSSVSFNTSLAIRFLTAFIYQTI